MEARDILADPELFLGLLDHLREAVYLVDRQRRIVYWNAAAEQITGYPRQDVLGRFCHSDILMHCDGQGQGLCGVSCPLGHVMVDGRPQESIVFLRHRHGHRIPVRVRARAVHNASGEITGAMELFEETPAIHWDELLDLEQRGCLDAATKALSRSCGEIRLRQQLLAIESLGGPAGWLRVSLAGLDPIQLRFGLAAVDAAAGLVARTLSRAVRPGDAVARWERTEFRVLIGRCDADDVKEAARLLETLVRCSEFEWWGEPVHIRVAASGTLVNLGDTVATVEARLQS